ncbi:MAG: DegT/DnrJ/EryC1/StrS family aminotransferase [Candidatus Thorarchaeota archaeon]
MKVPLFRISWNEEDVKAVSKIIRSGMYWCTGSEIAEFEEGLAKYLGLKHCIVLNSGGSALHASMSAHNIGPNDEVIIPSFSFIATAYAPLYVGAKPVFADIEDETFGLDPEDVKRKIGPKTKAIMPMHYGGTACRIAELREIADENNLMLVEDAAQAFGGKFGSRYLGTFGDSSIFSFCQNKIFTTSEGGCVVTDNDEVLEKLTLFRSYGRKLTGDYFGEIKDLDYVEPGYNFRMSTLLAALGISQLKRVHEMIDKRRNHAQYLNDGLREIEDLILPEPPSDDYFSVYQLYSIVLKQGLVKRNQLLDHLTKKGVSAKVYHDPIHKYSIFKDLGYGGDSLPVTEKISSQIISLPIFPDMTKDELDYVIDSMKEFY